MGKLNTAIIQSMEEISSKLLINIMISYPKLEKIPKQAQALIQEGQLYRQVILVAIKAQQL